MKCNEAFGMIFNGGEAVLPSREYSKDYRLHFNEDGVLCVPRVEHTKSAPVLHKADLKRDDWIVEKDGVIYEEYPIGKMRFIEQRVPLDTVKKYFGDRYDELKTPIIADQVNEEWLEKKMRCFIYKITRTDTGGCLYWQPKDKCRVKDCPFCFPDVSKEDKAQGAIDKPRKKVTVKHMDDLLQKIRGIAYKRGALRQAWLDADEMDYVNDFQQKLEYLVSLQETKCLLNK